MADGSSAELVRVMLVEDHASFRQALALVLNMEPDFVVVAEAGSLADARAVSEGVDFAIVDLALPDGTRLASPGPWTQAPQGWWTSWPVWTRSSRRRGA